MFGRGWGGKEGDGEVSAMPSPRTRRSPPTQIDTTIVRSTPHLSSRAIQKSSKLAAAQEPDAACPENAQATNHTSRRPNHPIVE
jgi:hypothetical protein